MSNTPPAVSPQTKVTQHHQAYVSLWPSAFSVYRRTLLFESTSSMTFCACTCISMLEHTYVTPPPLPAFPSPSVFLSLCNLQKAGKSWDLAPQTAPTLQAQLQALQRKRSREGSVWNQNALNAARRLDSEEVFNLLKQKPKLLPQEQTR